MVSNEMMRRGLFGLAALGMVAGAVTGTPVRAQEATPAHLAAARSAVEAINATDQFDNILMNAATQIKADLIGNNPDIQVAISDMVDEQAIALAPRRSALEGEVARVYAKYFTEQELKDIAAFYSSEAGKKLIAQGPVASREVLVAADVWSNGIVRDLRTNASRGVTALVPQSSEAVAPTTDPAAAPEAGAAAPAPGAGATSTQ